MRRFFSSALVLFISLVAGYLILSIWRGVSVYQANLSEETLRKATHALPSNPDPFYRLGLFYQWDIRHIDLKQSLAYLIKAIERNPLEQDYWLNLAKISQRMGESRASEHALKNAVLLYPAGYQGRWVAGNLLLQQGSLEKALPHFSYILANYPNQSAFVYDVLVKTVDDPDFILEKVVPRDPVSFKQYLSFLYEAGDHESLRKAWHIKDSFGYRPDRDQTLRHVDFLVVNGELNEAFQIWKDRLQEEGIPLSSDGNLMINGGFEKEKILGGAFDWNIQKVPGAEISFDPAMSVEGKRSLKIVFDGKENVDFYHVYQFVSLKPDTEYLLQADIRTQAVTTKSGLKIEISGVGPGFYKASEALTGDNDWKELTIAFRTPPQSQGGMVRIRREKTDKFDRFISGTVWLDAVRLEERSH